MMLSIYDLIDVIFLMILKFYASNFPITIIIFLQTYEMVLFLKDKEIIKYLSDININNNINKKHDKLKTIYIKSSTF